MAPMKKGGKSGFGGFGSKSHGGKSHMQGKKVPGAKPRASKPKTGGVNPFDVRSNAKTKYEVLGRRVKGTGRNVAVARADAESKRKKTLSTQFKQRNKANAFNDKRLGETDPEMTLEDKMMARFQTERKRKMRNTSAFALQDSDDEQDDDEGGNSLFLTHQGEKIDDYDKLNNGDGGAFDDEDEDDETRKMDREIIEKLHFGGGSSDDKDNKYGPKPTSDGKKTHKEIMQEVMMKSKMFKAERQKNKASQEDSTDHLDSEFASLRDLLSFRPTKGSQEAKALEREERKAEPMDEFDKLTRELTFEAKAQATERRMTPEETAKREHDRLAELEKKRQARMNGEDDGDDSDDEDAGGKKGRKGSKKGKKAPQMIIMRPPTTDDDLAFDYEVDHQYGGSVGEEEEAGEEDEADAEEDDEEEEEGSDAGSDEEGEDVDEEAEDAEEDEEEDGDEEEDEEEDEDATAKAADRKRKRQEAAEELPFVFPCPETPEDLLHLFKKHAKGSAERRGLIVERIIKFYSPKLSADNGPKMKSFFAILVRQFLKYGKQYAIHKQDLDALAKHLFALAQEVGETSGIVVRELLINLRKRLHATKTVSKYPLLSELLLCKALIQIFPTSDLRHNVISPMETLLSESLVRGSVDSPSDATHALFTCTLLLQMTKEKQRFNPEILITVKKLLRAFAVDNCDHWLRRGLVEWLATDEETLPVLSLASASSVSAPAVLRALLSLLEIVADQYAALPSFDELVYPSYLLLHELAKSLFQNKPAQLHALNGVIARLHSALEKCWSARAPLRLQTFGPTVLPAFTPKFDANYSLRKDKTLDREKAKTKQLVRQVKRARKNAARELRRDASFLAREKQQEETARVADKKEKQREIWKWLEEQNATFNEQAKKGGELLKGGGSGPAKKRRTSKKQ